MHIFVGMLLIPIVALKLISTGYRFARYYTRQVRYLEAGPPKLVPRLLAPLVVVTTVALFTTGVALLVKGPPSHRVVQLHQLSFIAWGVAVGLHVLLYLPRLWRLVVVEWQVRIPGLGARRAIVAAALAGGLVLAGLTFSLASPWLDRHDDEHHAAHHSTNATH